MSDTSVIIGQRIRQYRKQQKMTLVELAEKIHKSKASVSKYEQGSVPVDIDTLILISRALRISIHRFIDIPEDIKEFETGSERPIWLPNKLYFYVNGFSSGKINSGIIDIHPADYTVSLFLNPESDLNYMNTSMVFRGKVHANPIISQFEFYNETSSDDAILIQFMTSVSTQQFFIGQCIAATLPPQVFSSKCLISKIRLEPSVIETYLEASQLEVRTLRKNSIFRIDPSLQYDETDIRIR